MIAVEFTVGLLVLALLVGLIIGVRFGVGKDTSGNTVRDPDPSDPDAQ